jgi:hypothetical protein
MFYTWSSVIGQGEQDSNIFVDRLALLGNPQVRLPDRYLFAKPRLHLRNSYLSLLLSRFSSAAFRSFPDVSVSVQYSALAFPNMNTISFASVTRSRGFPCGFIRDGLAECLSEKRKD